MTYYDLTIDKYLQIKEILEQGEDDLQMQVAMLCVINECGEDDLLDLPLNEYKRKAAELSFLRQSPQPRPQCPKTITIDKEVYESIRDIKKLTAGQYIDYQSLLKSEDFYSIIPNILAIFFVPKGKDYGKGYDIMDEVEKIRNNISIGFALDVCFFFQMQSISSIKRTLDCLVLMTKVKMFKTKDKEMKEKLRTALEKIQELKDSFVNGLGSIKLT